MKAKELRKRLKDLLIEWNDTSCNLGCVECIFNEEIYEESICDRLSEAAYTLADQKTSKAHEELGF